MQNFLKFFFNFPHTYQKWTSKVMVVHTELSENSELKVGGEYSDYSELLNNLQVSCEQLV